jgi:hypothetical protein
MSGLTYQDFERIPWYILQLEETIRKLVRLARVEEQVNFVSP